MGLRSQTLGLVAVAVLGACSSVNDGGQDPDPQLDDGSGSGGATDGSGGATDGSGGDKDGSGTGGGATDGSGGDSATGGMAAGGDDGTGSGGNSAPPDPAANGCSKVDIVFAVDGSESMTEELVAMRDVVFPAFAEKLHDAGPALSDFRVGTLDACPVPANMHTRGNAGDCNFTSGNVWVDGDASDFEDEIACVGDLYQGDRFCTGWNDDEQPVSAIATALEQATPNMANAGFLRDNSLVVAIAITDEDEQPTTLLPTPEGVYERLYDAVGGDPRRVVLLGIGGASKCTGPYGDALDATFLKQVVARFSTHQRGIFWDLCQGHLEDGLEEAVEIIKNACETLPPPDEPTTPIPPPEPEPPCPDLDGSCEPYTPPVTDPPLPPCGPELDTNCDPGPVTPPENPDLG